MSKFKVGDKVKLKYFTETQRPIHWDNEGRMDIWMNQEVTIQEVIGFRYYIKEDSEWYWIKSDFKSVYIETDFLDDTDFLL